jgi:MFS family permease
MISITISVESLTTVVLCLSVFLLFADQNLLAPNLSLVAEEFGFDAFEKDKKLGGDIALGFFLVGGIVAILIGYLADSTSRRCELFAAIVFLGEFSCLLTYFSRSYWELFTCRILTGISIIISLILSL